MPAGTTWLDIVTLLIAILGLGVAVAGVVLAIRRDRRESKAEIMIDAYPEGGDLVVNFTNASHRPLSITRAGFNALPTGPREPFFGWRGINPRSSAGRLITDSPLPSQALQPGDPPYAVRAPLHVIKSATYPAGVISVWCEDERRNYYRLWLSVAAKRAVWSVKRRAPGPDDDYGQPTEVEVEDD